MNSFLTQIGTILLFSVIVLAIYYTLHKFVLSKIKVNKWVIFAIAALDLVVVPFLFPTMPYIVSNYVIPGIFVILIIWFLDLSGFMNHYGKKEKSSSNYYKYSGKKQDKDIKIKPKAKPNRVREKK